MARWTRSASPTSPSRSGGPRRAPRRRSRRSRPRRSGCSIAYARVIAPPCDMPTTAVRPTPTWSSTVLITRSSTGGFPGSPAVTTLSRPSGQSTLIRSVVTGSPSAAVATIMIASDAAGRSSGGGAAPRGRPPSAAGGRPARRRGPRTRTPARSGDSGRRPGTRPSAPARWGTVPGLRGGGRRSRTGRGRARRSPHGPPSRRSPQSHCSDGWSTGRSQDVHSRAAEHGPVPTTKHAEVRT